LLHLAPLHKSANKIWNRHTNRITLKWHRHSCLCSDDLAHQIRARTAIGSSPVSDSPSTNHSPRFSSSHRD
jgi:hypothetical protein